MIEVRREHYLGRLHRFLDAPVIIAVVGLRRVGKSVLLRQFAESLREQRQVVYVDRESLELQIRTTRESLERQIAHSLEVLRADNRRLLEAFTSHAHDADGNIIFRVPPPAAPAELEDAPAD